MSGPPPLPGTTSSPFSAPPQTYRPLQPGQQQTVRIDGKDYPIPVFTHTIQSPTQCDPVLTEAYFGPYLRFKNVDLQRNLWLGSILLVLPTSLPPPEVRFHPSGDYSRMQTASPQQFHTYDSYSFVRYDLVLPIYPNEQRWTYAVTTQGTKTWEFVVAGQQQQWRFIAWSCNDFSASVKKEEREKLGFGTLWKDVMERSVKEGGYHAQLGGGDQIYADRMWSEIPFVLH
jgi:PhoD related phosphatase